MYAHSPSFMPLDKIREDPEAVVQRGSRPLWVLRYAAANGAAAGAEKVLSVVVTDGGSQRPRGPHEPVTCSCA